jgi:type 1 glutamine amidotransferase
MRTAALFSSVVLVAACAACATPAPARRVLVFSKTTGFRHHSIPAGIAAIRRLGRTHGFAVDATENAGRFTERNLDGYAAVVFLSTTGDPLGTPAQKRALRRYVEHGGGFLGIHAAADSGYDWRWYGGLVGARFRGHPPGAPEAVVRIEDPRTPATRTLPRAWRRADEWYSFRTDPRRHVHVLATLDESTYAAGAIAMGADHPIAWCHAYDGGRAVYTALGHTIASYTEPAFLRHLLGAIRMAEGAAWPPACARR